MRSIIFAFCLMNTVCCFADSIFQPFMDQALDGLKQRDNQMQSQQNAVKESHAKAINSWVGSDINEKIMQAGPPSKQYKIPSKGGAYEWLYSEIRTQYDDEPQTYWCKILFFTDVDGKIVNGREEGNDCY